MTYQSRFLKFLFTVKKHNKVIVIITTRSSLWLHFFSRPIDDQKHNLTI